MNYLRMSVLLMLVLVLSACAGTAPIAPSPVVPTVLPTEQSVTQDNSATGETGLVVQGTVTLDGRPLEGVKIYRSFASYEGEIVAVSGKDGTYRSEFMFIPGDEMVTVWAELDGYTFTPENEYWRHYYGYEERTLDFSGAKVKP
jgi:hypothetical protein